MIHNETSLNNISPGPAYTFRDTRNYIITDAKHTHLIVDCQTLDHHPLNFSDHLPLSITLSFSSITTSTLRSKPTLNWCVASTDGSAEAYAKCVDDIVRPYLGKAYTSLDNDIKQVSTSTFKLPYQSSLLSGQKGAKKRFPNNPELKDLSIRCQQA